MNIYEIGMNKGVAIGVPQGRLEKLVEQVCKKFIKGHSVEEIADMLEETPDSI